MMENNTSDDALDQELRSALRGRVDQIGSPVLDTGALMTAVQQDRAGARVRNATLIGGTAVAVVAVVAIVGSTTSPAGDGGGVASDPTSGQPPSSSESPSSEDPSSPQSPSSDASYESLPDIDRAILMQLTARRDVRNQLLGDRTPSDLVLCAIDHIGSGSANIQYVWLYCGTYTTGEGAANVSGGLDPAVIQLSSPDSPDVQVVSIEFPQVASYDADIERMFPESVRQRIVARDAELAPSEQELLAIASNTH